MKKSIAISVLTILSLFFLPKLQKNSEPKNLKNGKELTYFENGSVKSEANYKNNGEISKTYIYEMGKYIK
ncbi:hypothetical protein [Cetobacterium sp.]|uniref:hypothetical protein n=1 Tax=Cetobacterium sp. TaxID=2071632 RepID=UPI003F2A4E35